VQIVNFGSSSVNIKLNVDFDRTSFQLTGSKKTVLTSSNVLDENSLEIPTKVISEAYGFWPQSNHTFTILLFNPK